MTVNREDVEAAARRILGRIRRTPVLPVSDRLAFKLELLQHVGSFKPRGAFNRLLTAKEEGTLAGPGVVTASGGNAGLAAAYAARELGVPARIFLPTTAPAQKVARLRTLDADVVQLGHEYADAYAGAVLAQQESGALLVHAYDQPEIVAGQGTLGLNSRNSWTASTPSSSRWEVAGWWPVSPRPSARAHGSSVSSRNSRRRCAGAVRAGRPVDVEVGGCAADSLGARRLGALAYQAVVANDVQSLLVDEDAVVAARQALWREYRLAVEHGTAAAHAALLSGIYRPERGERVVVVLCGANTDPRDLT
jgi:threonine dehydratase